MHKKIRQWFLLPIVLFLMTACDSISISEEIDPSGAGAKAPAAPEEVFVVEGQAYNQAQEVVDYLSAYDELPPNYLTKKEAQALGWEASAGNLWEVAPERSIGGDFFGNFEDLLPEATSRDYFEADINYEGGYRNGERLVFSNDGLYFYTGDHYKSFETLYPGGEKNENINN